MTTRRLKAAIDVLQPILTPDHRKPFGKVLRNLRRRLGPLRDADVMIDHLEHLGKLPHDRRSRAGYIEPVALSVANRRQIEPRRPALGHLLMLCLPRPTASSSPPPIILAGTTMPRFRRTAAG